MPSTSGPHTGQDANLNGDEDTRSSTVDTPAASTTPQLKVSGRRGTAFWLVILGINISAFLAFLEATSISNALPTIVSDLRGADFIWVGAAYNLASAACMPSMGVLAQIFGRKPVLVAALAIFSLGSALCGAAQNMAMLIGGRVVQGIGAAGISTLASIIISDVVPLSERGIFNGLLQLTWCLASVTGLIVGGTLAERGAWRWIFYLNLPIAPVAGLLVVTSLHLKTPPRSWRENIQILDSIGNFLVITGSTLFAIGLTWGGVTFSWKSAHVLCPLCIGAAMMIAFVIYEYRWSPRPLAPVKLMKDRTVLSGYLQVFIFPIPFIALVYYLPIYLQACKGLSPIRSGVVLFGLAFSTPPIAMISGIAVTITKRYRAQLWVGWAVAIVGLVLLGTTHADTPLRVFIGYEIVVGAGFGVVFSATYFPVLAPLPVTSMAQALAFYAFLRQFTQIWGIAVGGAILQNELTKNLHQDILSQILPGQVALSIVPELQGLPPVLLQQARVAFAQSLDKVWQIMAGITGAGLLVSFLMKRVPLHTQVDDDWGVEEKKANESQDIANNGKL